ncbi:hypothetical protein U1Q18_049465, partial [Sarracenia purpurea var. burkii]
MENSFCLLEDLDSESVGDLVQVSHDVSDGIRASRKEKSERTPYHVIRDVAELRIKLLSMVRERSVNHKCARAVIATSRDLEAEVNRAKDDAIESPRMVALEARIQRLKGISPVRIKEFASELNLNAIRIGGNIQEIWATTEAEGVAPLSSEGKVSRSVSGKCDSDSLPDIKCQEIYEQNVGCKSGNMEKQIGIFEASPRHELHLFDTLASKPVLEDLEMENVEESIDEAGVEDCIVGEDADPELGMEATEISVKGAPSPQGYKGNVVNVDKREDPAIKEKQIDDMGKQGSHVPQSAQEVVYKSANQVAVSSGEARPSATGAKIESGREALGNRDSMHKLDRGSLSWANIVASNGVPRPYAG